MTFDDEEDIAHASCYSDLTLKTTKPPEKPPETYERPTPKVSRLKRGKVLSAAEREAFVASRPDLKKSD